MSQFKFVNDVVTGMRADMEAAIDINGRPYRKAIALWERSLKKSRAIKAREDDQVEKELRVLIYQEQIETTGEIEYLEMVDTNIIKFLAKLA